MLRFLTAGESHGQALVAILEGVPAGLAMDFDAVTAQLRRRQGGYGRGRRMAIESDRAEALSGIRHGVTTGAPIALLIPNKDWENWQRTMHVEPVQPADASGTERPAVTRPGPGHADLAGVVKYGHDDIRNVLERASARETAARVAVGAVARQLLAAVGAEIVEPRRLDRVGALPDPLAVTFDDVRAIRADAPLHCVDAERRARDDRGDRSRARRRRHDGRQLRGDRARRAAGLGSYVQWDRKLDGRLAQALMSIPAIKAVGIGRGPDVGVAARLARARRDSAARPAPRPPSGVGVARPTNNAGGLEGGVTNGEDLRVSGYMKPIATLMKPLRSVDLTTMAESPAAIERSDVCAVPAAAVVAEAMVAFVLADALTREVRRRFDRRAARELAGVQ